MVRLIWSTLGPASFVVSPRLTQRGESVRTGGGRVHDGLSHPSARRSHGRLSRPDPDAVDSGHKIADHRLRASRHPRNDPERTQSVDGRHREPHEWPRPAAGQRLPGKCTRDQARSDLFQPQFRVTAFPVRHGELAHAFGYRFEAADRTIVISGDTAPTPDHAEHCRDCDVLIHEAYSERTYRKSVAAVATIPPTTSHLVERARRTRQSRPTRSAGALSPIQCRRRNDAAGPRSGAIGRDPVVSMTGGWLPRTTSMCSERRADLTRHSTWEIDMANGHHRVAAICEQLLEL